MSVAYYSTSNSGAQTYVSSFGWAHDSGTDLNRLLIVFVEMNASESISGVTYNGVAMTLVREQTLALSPIPRVAMYQLVNPASGSNTVTVTLSGTMGDNEGATGGALSFSNVDQIAPIRDHTYQTGGWGEGGTDYDLLVSSVNGDFIVAGLLTELQCSYSTNGTLRWGSIQIKAGWGNGLTKPAATDANGTEAGWTTSATGGIVIVASIKSHIEGNAPFFYQAGGDY